MSIEQTLFIDGDCALCTRTAWFIDRRDRKRTLRFEALESEAGRALEERHAFLRSVDSLVWVDRDTESGVERVSVHSGAALSVARYLGGRWRLLGAIIWCVPRPLRDAGYRVIARHRKRFFT